MIRFIKYSLLFMAMLVSIAMYHPIVFLSSLYGSFRNIAIGFLMSLVILSFPYKQYLQITLIRRFCFLLVFIAFELFSLYSFTTRSSWADLIQLSIVLFFIVIGVGVYMSKTMLECVGSVYSILALVMGGLSLNYYLGGFNLLASQFLIEGKNQIGAIVAIGGAITFYFSQNLQSRRRYFYLTLSVLLFITLVVVRCRTALIAYVFFVAIYIWRFWPKKKKVYMLILSSFFLILYIDSVLDVIRTVLFKNDDLADLDKISTGRLERNIQGLSFLSNHLFTGELFEDFNMGLIHNYVLLKLVNYGIWAFPMITIYILFFVEIVRTIKRKIIGIEYVGVYILIIPFFCSLLEPSAPFGPGTVQMMPYVLLGVYLHKVYLNND